MRLLTGLCLLLLAAAANTQSVIHRCVDTDGNIAFQDSPCPEAPSPAATEPDNSVSAPPAPEAAVPRPTPDESTLPPARNTDGVSFKPEPAERTPEETELCKQPLRDAIDAIEAEMLQGYSAEQGEAFKQELHGLTQQMRACE